MNKSELKTYFIDIGVLNKQGQRKFCWKTKLDDDSKNMFNEYAQNYRTQDEAWFCLTHDCEPAKCYCGKIAVFKDNRYKTTCETCNPNANPEKIKHFKTTMSSKTDVDKKNSFEKRKNTIKEKYGDENYSLFGSQSFKDNLLNKYGDEHYHNVEKAKITFSDNLENNSKIYSAAQLKRWADNKDEILSKTKHTIKEKYGVEYVTQSSDVIDKMQVTKRNNIKQLEEQYNCTSQENLFSLYGQGWLILHIPKTHINGHSFISNTYLPKITSYEPQYNIAFSSNKENEIADYIESLGYKTLRNDRKIICPYELDIYVCGVNLAIEFNGNYWHSTQYKNAKYHKMKTDLCAEKNIRLLHIYEYEWDNHKEIIKSIIESACRCTVNKIMARKCKIINVDAATEKNFINDNHLQGYIPSKYAIGLEYEGELVEIATFGKSRFERNKIELLRSCSKLHTTVIGGFSKLIKHCKYNEITTYVNLSKFNGNSYLKSGFTVIGITPPNYVYIKNNVILSRYQCQKKKLEKLLPDFDATLSETENMIRNNWLKVYDCGNLKMIKNTKI